MTRKRFIKLLMGRIGLTRNEANYVADIVRLSRAAKWGCDHITWETEDDTVGCERVLPANKTY